MSESTQPTADVSDFRQRLTALRELDPSLDPGWKNTVVALYNSVDPKRRRYVLDRILGPKGIYIDRDSGKLAITGAPSIEELLKDGLMTRAVDGLAGKLKDVVERMRKPNTCSAFADYVEGGLSAVDSFEASEDLQMVADLAALRHSFLEDIIRLTPDAPIEAEDNYRGIGVDTFKDYLLQVFVRQQIAGHGFRPQSAQLLAEHANPYIRLKVAPEAVRRQCIVRQTGKQLYVIGAAPDARQNPYSIRRFMAEEEGLGGSEVYVNVVVIPLTGLRDEVTRRRIDVNLARIVTIRHQLGEGVKEAFAGIEKQYDAQVAPMLVENMAADGAAVERAVQQQLSKFELGLCREVLSPMAELIRREGMSGDDKLFLFPGFRALLLRTLEDVATFNIRPAAAFSDSSESLELRLLAYLKLFDKRQAEIASLPPAGRSPGAMDHDRARSELRKLLRDSLLELTRLKAKRDALAKRANRSRPAWLKWLLARLRKADKPTELALAEQHIARASSACAINCIRIFKNYDKVSLFMELEGLVDIRGDRRRYALAAGDAGLAGLPLLITLPEARDRLRIADLLATLNVGA